MKPSMIEFLIQGNENSEVPMPSARQASDLKKVNINR
jgi:hypothetical protein